jgi:glycosyltransferase involved in cell wall biosynthesis
MESTLGGTRKYIIDLLERLNLERFEVTFGYSTVRADPLFFSALSKVQQRDIRLFELPMKRHISLIADSQCFFRIWNFIRMEKPHIVHCHSSKAGFLGRMAGKLAFTGAKTIFTPHGLSTNVHPNYWVFEKVASWFTDVAVAVSESEKNYFRKKHLFDDSNSTTITLGLDCSRENPRFLIREYLKIPQNSLLVASVGLLNNAKNPLGLLEAAKHVIKKNCRVHFIWIGDGELRKEVEAFISKHELQSNCHLIGWHSFPESILVDCDIFALTSRYESFGYVLCEAMLENLPVVATNVTGARSIVVDGKTGYLVSYGDWQVFAWAILDLVEKRDLRMRMGVAGKERVKENFNVDKMISETEALYVKLASTLNSYSELRSSYWGA